MKDSLKYVLCSSHHNPAVSFCVLFIITNFVYSFDVKIWGQRLGKVESKEENSRSVNLNGSNK